MANLAVLKDLAESLLIAKSIEDDAKAKRIAIEAQIASMVDLPAQGQRTYKADVYSLTLKTGFNYKLIDKDNYMGLLAGGEVPDIFSPSLSDSKLNVMRKDGTLARISSHLDISPAKIAVTVAQVKL